MSSSTAGKSATAGEVGGETPVKQNPLRQAAAQLRDADAADAGAAVRQHRSSSARATVHIPTAAAAFRDASQEARERRRDHSKGPGDMRYSWAVVMHNVVPKGVDAQHLRVMQEVVVESLMRLNLEVLLLRHTNVTQDKLVIMVGSESENDELLKMERELLETERFLKFGMMNRDEDDEDHSENTLADREKRGIYGLTPAEKLILTAEMVERALDMARRQKEFRDAEIAVADVIDKDHKQRRQEALDRGELHVFDHVFNPIIESFPVHDEVFNKRFMESLKPTKSMFCSWQSWKDFFNLHHKMDELRDQFGSRIAFYFAFVNYYTRWLYPLTAYAVVYYCIVRPLDWSSYQRGLAVLGFLTPSLWAPLFIKFFTRYANSLSFHWRLWDVPERVYENPHSPEYVVRKNPKTKEEERVYDPRNVRLKVKLATVPFAIFNLIILILVATPFVQWYVYGKLAPTCECCEWFHELEEHNGTAINLSFEALSAKAHMEGVTGCDSYIRAAGDPGYKPPSSCTYFVSCFDSVGGTVGTDRWVYILIQGIILGLALDVFQFEVFVAFTTWLTKKENWDTEAEFERRVIRKQFVFMWANMYFWFLALAFIYVPFGDKLQELLINIGLGTFVPGHGWRSGVINIDEAFVTPLVVTQAINLTLETFIPVIVGRIAEKKKQLERAARRRSSSLKKGTRRGLTKFSHGFVGGFTAVADVVSRRSSSATSDDIGALPALEAADRGIQMTALSSGAAAAEPDVIVEEPDEAVASEAPGDSLMPPAEPLGMVATKQPQMELKLQPGSQSMLTADEEKLASSEHINTPVSAKESKQAKSMAVLGVRVAYHEVSGLVSEVRATWMRKATSQAAAVHNVQALLTFADTTEDSNDYDANAVIKQSEMSEFHPRTDYLDMMMQFGYVTMFTTAWALAPVCAVINNVLEIRGDCFKLMFGNRRPVPVEDKNIGEWQEMLWLAVQLSVTVSAGLIVIGTGQAEYWAESYCERREERIEEAIMGPDLLCFSSWGIRLGIALALEHVGFFIIHLVRTNIDDRTPNLKGRLHVRDVTITRIRQDRMLPDMEDSFARNLRHVFDFYCGHGTPEDVRPAGTGHSSAPRRQLSDKRHEVERRQLNWDQCGQMLRDLHRLVPLMKVRDHGVPPGVLPEQMVDELVRFIDVDETKSITYAECASAVKRAGVDPLMFALFAANFAAAVAHRAGILRGEEPDAGLDAIGEAADGKEDDGE